MKKYMLLGIYSLLSVVGLAQQPVVEWAKTYGGKQWDIGQSIVVTPDNKYVICGGTSSQDNDSLPRPTKLDGLIMKVDSDGKILWQRIYGGNGNDFAAKIIQTLDGGFIIVGNSASNDGIFSTNKGGYDVWILKLDSLGMFQWQKTYGGTDLDEARSIVQDKKGEFLFIVNTLSKTDDFNENMGQGDVWIVKISSKGDIIWKKRYGGTNGENLHDLVKIDDKSYVAVGETRSTDGDMVNTKGDIIIKIDSSGNTLWKKSYGSPENDISYFNGYNSVIITKDGSLMALGYAMAFGIPSLHYSHDYLLTKIDRNGNRIWSKLYGGSKLDVGQNILQLTSGEFIVIGNTYSSDGDIAKGSLHGIEEDIWVLKLDSIGQIIWETCLGGTEDDYPRGSVSTKDGIILITGDTKSSNGTFAKNNGSFDLPLIKLKDVIKTSVANKTYFNNFKYYPNPVNQHLIIENNTADILKIKLVNAIGQIIFNKSYNIGTFDIDCSHLPTGFYNLILTEQNNNTISKKIIVQR